ncbi:RagB/SusD family nutrient uptake outer membrane protein [Flavobacterium subsaxonicum]|uniref:Carbohydrate-binding protein SusD n=1 Tax=Flavobacterium subsaxonicum WB 4.1-42 = DSM 21790 TaxID=1121898 RepID=A0A0A2MRY2_9FLAO|nr:RagB/SusD family nutrient uptake outer membrane protein [Flavobacterium subsaxonicum]KGO94351.1 hypothetical protein Q766_05380 [Flavobacterium subsaxonicum WB 4.1-42 = DSM 21790]
MKNLKKIFILTLAAGALYSCNDAYEIIQPGELNYDNAFENVSDLNLALNEVYDNVIAEDIIAFTSVVTDETAIADQNGGQNLDEYRFQIFATNDYASDFWLDNYTTIMYANRILEKADGVELDSTDATTLQDDIDERLRIVSEARALRAYSHFQLLSYFSTDLKNDSALGVILMDHVSTKEEQLPRSTNGEVFNFINEDLDFAQENASLLVGNGPSQITPRAINALRARISAYRGLYEEAKAYAVLAITGSTGLATTEAAYKQIWSDVSLTEVIWGLERPSGKTGIVSNWFFNSATYAGGPFLDMGRNLYAELTEDSNDYRGRTGVFIGATSIIAEDYATVFDYKNSDVLIIAKYPGVSGLLLNNRVKAIRLPEMYYIKAEAEVAAGDLVAARNTLQEIKTARAIVKANAVQIPAFENATQAWKAILDERRIELCYEGHRYIDLKRLGTLAGVNGVQRYERDCTPYSACELLVTDYRFTLPIPVEELNGNRVIREQQNPGY